MKKIIRITAIALTTVFMMMLVASLVPTGNLAYAVDDGPKLKAQSIDNTTPELGQSACSRLGKCHGFWGCLKRAAQCIVEILS